MKHRTAPAALALLLGSAGLAHAAQTITSPGLPTATNTSAACYLRNGGTRPVFVQMGGLLNYTPGIVIPDFQNCNDAPLAPGKSCVFLLNQLDDDITFACAAVVSSPRSVRGAVEIREITPAGPKVIASEEMQ